MKMRASDHAYIFLPGMMIRMKNECKRALFKYNENSVKHGLANIAMRTYLFPDLLPYSYVLTLLVISNIRNEIDKGRIVVVMTANQQLGYFYMIDHQLNNTGDLEILQ